MEAPEASWIHHRPVPLSVPEQVRIAPLKSNRNVIRVYFNNGTITTKLIN